MKNIKRFVLLAFVLILLSITQLPAQTRVRYPNDLSLGVGRFGLCQISYQRMASTSLAINIGMSFHPDSEFIFFNTGGTLYLTQKRPSLVISGGINYVFLMFISGYIGPGLEFPVKNGLFIKAWTHLWFGPLDEIDAAIVPGISIGYRF